MKLEVSAARGVRWTTLSSVANAITDTVRTIILARFLSPLDYGLMAMVSVVTGFTQMYIDLGVSAAIIHRQDTTKEQLSSLYWLNVLVGAAVFVLFWFCSPVAALYFREPRILPLLKCTALVFLIVPIGSQFEILLQKELEFSKLARWEMAAAATGTSVAIGCAVTGLGVWALVFSLLSNVTLKTFLLCRVGFARSRPSFHFKTSDLKGYLSFGFFQLGERSVNYLAERLDLLLIGPLLGAKALGFYTFALYFTSQPVSRINPILTRVAFPVFSRLQDDPARLRRGYMRLLRLIATVNAPLLIGFATVAPWMVPYMFGKKWTDSVVLVQLLSFVALSRCLGNPIGSLQLAKGRADQGFWWNLFLLGCTIPTIYCGAKYGGTLGVAISLLVLQIVVSVPFYRYMVRPLLGECAGEYLAATLKPIAVAGAMGLIVLCVSLVYHDLPVTTTLLFQIGVGAAAYVGLAKLFNKAAFAEFRVALFSR